MYSRTLNELICQTTMFGHLGRFTYARTTSCMEHIPKRSHWSCRKHRQGDPPSSRIPEAEICNHASCPLPGVRVLYHGGPGSTPRYPSPEQRMSCRLLDRPKYPCDARTNYFSGLSGSYSDGFPAGLSRENMEALFASCHKPSHTNASEPDIPCLFDTRMRYSLILRVITFSGYPRTREYRWVHYRAVSAVPLWFARQRWLVSFVGADSVLRR